MQVAVSEICNCPKHPFWLLLHFAALLLFLKLTSAESRILPSHFLLLPCRKMFSGSQEGSHKVLKKGAEGRPQEGGTVLRWESVALHPKETTQKPKYSEEPQSGPGKSPLIAPETARNSDALLLAHASYFPNEIFGDLLYKLSSVTTVNRYITRNATGPDGSSS